MPVLAGIVAAVLVFGVLPAASGTATGVISVSNSADRSAAGPLDGAAVSGSVYVFVDAPGASRVTFYLDDPAMSKAVRSDRTNVFDLVGGTASGALPFDTTRLAAGTHELVASIKPGRGPASAVKATFTTSGSTSPTSSTSTSTTSSTSSSTTSTTAAGGSAGTGTSSAPQPLDLGTNDIRAYLSLTGGRTVVVPNGRYTGGQVTATHSDWLVLVAETKGQVVVDDYLDLLAGSSKIAFVGFAFRGMVRTYSSSDVVFWYADASNPATSYKGQRPDFLWSGSNGGPYSAGVRVLGSDLHDLGDDGIQLGGATDVFIEGTSFVNITNQGLNTAQWHNDAVQWTGGGSRHRLRFNDFGQKLQVGANWGNLADIQITDFWARNSTNYGFIFGVYTSSVTPGSCDSCTITASRANGYSWNAALRKDRGDFVNSTEYPMGTVSRIRVTDTGIVAGAPPAGTVNPVTVWRSQNPYESYGSYLAGLGAVTAG